MLINAVTIKFHEEFQTEEDCQKKLIKLRWSDGFLCSHCKGKRLLWFTKAISLPV